MVAEMPDIPRLLELSKMLARKSGFLFGPRQTGKSWLVRHALRDARVYNLLDHATYVDLSRNPARIEQEWLAGSPDRVVVIDEVQRLPLLLNEVHRLIEQHGIRFLLTGSSARKLRTGGSNLLGGRARIHHLHPFVAAELGGKFDMMRAVNHGLLPPLYFSDEPEEDLAAYAGVYLREEVAAEALTRNVPAFSRFLQVAALCNGQMLNYARVANDAQVPRSTVAEYFGILQDTLVGHEVPAWQQSVKRKAIATSKFYLFDCGVARHLQGRAEIRAGTPEFGQALETLLFHELRAYCDYRRAGEIAYWRSASGFEVDFIVADQLAVEVKATGRLALADLRGLRALREEGKLKSYVCVTLDPEPRVVDGISILPLRLFLERLWSGELLG